MFRDFEPVKPRRRHPIICPANYMPPSCRFEQFAAGAHELAFGSFPDAQKAPVAGDNLVSTSLGTELFVFTAKLGLQFSNLPIGCCEVGPMVLAGGTANFLHGKRVVGMGLASTTLRQ